jgi:hypothetical protein
MKLTEIWHSHPQRGFAETFEVDEIELDYEAIEDDPPIAHNPKAWMPDMRNRPDYAAKFQYEYTPAERGSRERGGLQLEPDYAAGVDIIGAEIYDPRTKLWIKVNPTDYFSPKALEKVEHDIMDSLEYSPPEREDYYDEDR